MDYVKRMKSWESRFRSLSGLKDRSRYAMFYCPVRPAPILVLGINPGGDPNDVLSDGVRLRSDLSRRGAASARYYENNEHSMLDCDWPENSIVDLLAEILGDREAIRDRVVKTNLAFRRSPGVDSFKMFHGMTLNRAYREAEPFVREIVEIVEPKLVLLEGSILKYFKRAVSAVNGASADLPIKTMHRGREIDLYRPERLAIPGVPEPVLVVQLAHPSYHGSKYLEEGIGRRIKDLLES